MRMTKTRMAAWWLVPSLACLAGACNGGPHGSPDVAPEGRNEVLAAFMEPIGEIDEGLALGAGFGVSMVFRKGGGAHAGGAGGTWA